MHVSKFADGSGVNAFVFDFRFTPEHQFPAALNDAITLYKHILIEIIQEINAPIP